MYYSEIQKELTKLKIQGYDVRVNIHDLQPRIVAEIKRIKEGIEASTIKPVPSYSDNRKNVSDYLQKKTGKKSTKLLTAAKVRAAFYDLDFDYYVDQDDLDTLENRNGRSRGFWSLAAKIIRTYEVNKVNK